jgi:hypothetical protein
MYPAIADQIAKFALFFLLFLALPSLALGLLLPLGTRSHAESFFWGYAPAQMLLFLLIFTGSRTGVPWLPAALPAASLLALPLLLRRQGARRAPAMQGGDLLLVLGAAALATGLCFIKFASFPLPTPGHPALFYQDDPGTAAFVWSAVNAIQYGVPYSLPWASGFPDYPYHRIYHFTYGFATYALGIGPVEQIMYFWAPAQWLMLVGAVVTGCRRFAGFSRLETGIALVLLLFSDGLDFNAQTSIQTIAYYHTFFYGLPAFLLLLLALYGYLGRQSRISPLLAACCFFVAAGVKANLLLFIPLSLFPVFLYRLYKRINIKLDLALAGSCIVSACVLFYTHYSNLGIGQARSKAFHLWPALMGTLGNLITMAYVVVPFLVIAVIAADRDVLLRERLRRDSQFHAVLLTFCVTSAIFLKVVGYIGGEVYFYWQARLMTLVAFAWLAAHALAWRTRVVAPVVALALVAGLWFFAGNIWAARHLGDSLSPADTSAKNIDADELAGLRWASRNLDRTQPFFTNKDSYIGHYLGAKIKTFMPDYMGFAGLQGYAWIGDCFSPKIQEAISSRRVWVDKFVEAETLADKEEALRHIDAAYYFHCEREHPFDFKGLGLLREVYRNPSLTIYEVVRPQPAPAGS